MTVVKFPYRPSVLSRSATAKIEKPHAGQGRCSRIRINLGDCHRNTRPEQ